tara:strand:+ start:2693 stop:4363 length:1671 start_codon:yes stop_codon:yes gene_type:complete
MSDNTSIYTNSMQEIQACIQACVPILWVQTHEEARFALAFEEEVAKPEKRQILHWSAYRGVIPAENMDEPGMCGGDWADTEMPIAAIEALMRNNHTKKFDGQVMFMKDFGPHINPIVARQLRDVYQHLINTKKTLVMVSPFVGHGGNQAAGIEPTLEKYVTIVDYKLPLRDHIRDRITGMLDSIKAHHKEQNIKSQTKLVYSDEEINEFAGALLGLTELEVDNAVMTCVAHAKALVTDHLLLQKEQIIKRGDVLEFIKIKPGFSEVGGNEQLKDYLRLYSDQFSEEAIEFGVDPIRGVLMVGVPGCGKSLTAKAVAAEWNLPLLRLDVGKVMTGLVGGSEGKMRQVVDQVEAVAPCVLWIDEIEKSLSGTGSSNFSDGGTLSRVFGTLLTAMEERMEGVVIIATANDIQALPPELIRRFSEVFFVDLPTCSERDTIFQIHFAKKGRDPVKLKLDMEAIVEASDLFTGSEIEKAVQESVARAFHGGKRKVKTEDVLGAISDTKPIAQTMDKKIGAIRKWAKGKARYASEEAEKVYKAPKKVGKKAGVGDIGRFSGVK